MIRPFITALIIGIRTQARVNGTSAVWPMLRLAWKIPAAFLPWGRVELSMWNKRMDSCERCFIYNHTRKTCGYVETQSALLGCGCFMPLKARAKAARCWFWERTGDRGWPKELNG